MPSIHRQPGRPYWFCAFSIWNPETLTSRRVFRSTKTRDKKQALEICRAWHKAALKARNGKLSVDAAREVIAQGVSDVFTAANTESLPSASIKSWCETWMEAKAIESGGIHARALQARDRTLHRVSSAKRKANATFRRCKRATLHGFVIVKRKNSRARLQIFSVKVLRVCFGEAVRQGLLTVNPAVRVQAAQIARQIRSGARSRSTKSSAS